MNIYKKVIRIYVIVSIIITSLIIGIFYYYDPMQIFHKSYLTKDLHLHENMRQQATGIIKNYKFDSIILGTSMLENTSAVEASNLLGGNFVNISMSGSDFYERNLVLSYALRKKNIKKVIYSLDYFAYQQQRRGDPLNKISTFDYLYDSNPINDFKLYWNDKFFKCIITLSKDSKCIGIQKTLEYPNAWFLSYSDKFGGLDNWIKVKEHEQIKSNFNQIFLFDAYIKKNLKILPFDQNYELKLKTTKDYIDETILSTVSKNPNTEFILFFPPYSRIFYAAWKQYDLLSYQIYKETIQYLVGKSSNYKNLKVYGFDDNDFIDDIANYKDLNHYSHLINSKMLNNFKNANGLLTKENVEQYIDISEKKALNYNITEISDKIKERLLNENISNPVLVINSIIDKDLDGKYMIFDIKQNNYFKNDQLELNFKNDSYNLNAINSDPIIILNETKATSKNVILSYEINSNIETTFQLFYKKENNSNYNEADSYKVPLKIGNNKINLLIPSEYINNNLRVDLVSNMGKYELKEFKIYSK